MSPTGTQEKYRSPSLATVLHRANMRIALIAMALVGVSIFLAGLIALRAYTIENLGLSARNIAYTVEAAVVFNDREAASEALSSMTASHRFAAVYVFDRDGDELSHWQETSSGGWAGLERLLAHIVLPKPAIAQIQRGGRPIGTVKLYGSGQDLLLFMMISAGCGLCCMLLCGIVASRLSFKSSLTIVEPLQHIADVAAKARRERQFQHRVEPANVAELQGLGDDFNALLEELESWQEQMLNHNELLAFKANHDPLTGLANRSLFEARLIAELAAANEIGGHVALFFIDADRFKSINDELGHEVGDIVLCAIARCLRSKVRESDVVARLGGDEFAVLLAPLSDPSQAGRIAANILDSMVEPIELPSGGVLSTSLSIGIALYPDHAADTSGLMKKADEAMYQAKRAGRGIYSVASELDSALPGV